MKFAVAAILGFAMTAVAIPAKEIRQRQFIADVSGQCATGDLYCCGPNIDGVTDDALDLLVKEGLLIERLVSGAESYCAPSTISKGVDTIFDGKSALYSRREQQNPTNNS